MSHVIPVDRQAIHDELEDARATFHRLLNSASAAELRRPSQGTRWTNEQLLFHMLFGYLIVRSLLTLVRIVGRLPVQFGRVFARALNSVKRPFDVVNYWGSCIGAKVFNHWRMGAKFGVSSLICNAGYPQRTRQISSGVCTTHAAGTRSSGTS